MGNFFANSAQWLQLLSVGWLVRSLTENSPYSALLVVTVGGLNTLPGLVIGPLAGVLGDRVDRRKLIMTVQTIMAVVAFTFALLVGSQLVTVVHAYLYVLISGLCLSITMPMRQALIANVVPREALGNAYATNVLTITGTRLLGPFFGGILIATLGFFWNFTAEALLYVANILMFVTLKTPFYQPRKASERGSVFSDLKEGFSYVWNDNRVIVYLIMLSLIPNVIMQPVMFLLPIFTDEVLRQGPDIGGFMLSINGFGGLIAALTISSFGFVFKRGMITLITALSGATVVILFSQAYWLPLAFLLIAMFGFSQSTFRTTSSTLIQTLVPDQLRGRVSSLTRYGQGPVVITSVVVGWFAGFTTVNIALATIGIIAFSCAVTFLLLAKRIREQP